MTSQTVGSPDWLRPTPTVNAPLATGGYADFTHATTTIGQYSLVGYDHVAIAWQPFKSCFMNIRQLTPTGALTAPNMVKQVMCVLGATARLTVPVLLGSLDVNVTNIDGSNDVEGNFAMTRYNGTDRRDAIQGPLEIIDQQNAPVAALGSITVDSALVAEGPATAFFLSTQPTCGVNIRALNATGAYDIIGQLLPTAANVPVMQPLFIPPRHIRCEIFNNAGAPASVYCVIVVGG